MTVKPQGSQVVSSVVTFDVIAREVEREGTHDES